MPPKPPKKTRATNIAPDVGGGRVHQQVHSSEKENASLRRSGRSAKGTGTLEKMQAISAQISQHNTRKRRDAPLDDIPAMTQDNPMAPQPKSRSKKKKTAGNEVPLNDREVPQLSQMPTPVQVAHLVPPGTEPSLTGRGYTFGCQLPPGSTATSTGMQSTQQSSLGLGRSQQYGHQCGSPATSMQSTQQPWPGHDASQLPSRSFATPTGMQGAQQSLPGSGRNHQPEFQFPPEQFAPAVPSSTANSNDHDQWPSTVGSHTMSPRSNPHSVCSSIGARSQSMDNHTTNQYPFGQTAAPSVDPRLLNRDSQTSTPTRHVTLNTLAAASGAVPHTNGVNRNINLISYDSDDDVDPAPRGNTANLPFVHINSGINPGFNEHTHAPLYQENRARQRKNDAENDEDEDDDEDNDSDVVLHDDNDNDGIDDDDDDQNDEDPLLAPGFNQSPSEDERIAEAHLRAGGTRQQGSDTRPVTAPVTDELPQQGNAQRNVEEGTYDVVANYHRRNRAPRAPDPDRLRAIQLIGRSGQRRENANAGQSEAETDSRPRQGQGQRRRAPRNSRKAYNASSDDPTKLRYYPTQWRKVIDKTQDYYRGWMVTECGYLEKNKSEHRDAARRLLHQALAEHQADGGRVEEGYFPEHEDDIISYLLADRSTLRGELKTIAKPIVEQFYNLSADSSIPNQLHAQRAIQQSVEDALTNGQYLRGPKDENGRTRNMQHPGIAAVCKAFYFAPGKLASKLPELFKDSIPEKAVIFVAVGIKHILDAYKKHGYYDKNLKFMEEVYMLTYDSLVRKLEQLKTDAYHWTSFCDARRDWARQASVLNGITSVEFDSDVELLLD